MRTERYNQCLAEEGIHKKTEDGNLKASPRKIIVEWILELRSFLWSEYERNDVFHCFEESQPYAWGRQMVKQQMEMSRDLEDQVILFLSITLIQRDKILMFDED